MGSMILGPLFGPAVGPVAGGYLAQAKGWRWTFWLVTIIVSNDPFLDSSRCTDTHRPVLYAS
jgi:MFS family permease